MDLFPHEKVPRQVEFPDEMLNQLPPARRAGPADTRAALDFGKLGERAVDQQGLTGVRCSPDKLALMFAQRGLKTPHLGLATD